MRSDLQNGVLIQDSAGKEVRETTLVDVGQALLVKVELAVLLKEWKFNSVQTRR